MAHFEQLQEIWRQQPSPRPFPVDPVLLAGGLRAFGRRQNIVNSIKLAAVLGILSWSAWLHPSPWFRAGAALVFSGALLMIAVDWRNQRRLARLDFSSPSVAFLDSAIRDLTAQQHPFHRQYWIFAAILAGSNLMFFGAFARPRPALHLGASLLCCGGFLLGLRIRRLRFERECRPLLHQLSASRDSLERLIREYDPDR